MASWRMKAARVIRSTIEANQGLDAIALRKAVSDAYPFGERKYHPYKIWLSEVNRQLGAKEEKHSIEMTIATAKEIVFELCDAYMFHDAPFNEIQAEQLRKLADFLDKSLPLLNADKVVIASKDAKFLMMLKRKLNETETV